MTLASLRPSRACALLLLLTAGCDKPYGSLGNFTDSDAGAETDSGSDTDAAPSTGEEPATGGDAMCTPGEEVSDGCSNVCVCNDEGTAYECTDKGCPDIDEGFEIELVKPGGCADMVMLVGDEPGLYMLHLEVEGLVAAAHEAGAAQTTTFAMSDPALTAEMLTGEGLHQAFCNDAVLPFDVIYTYKPVAGTVTFTVDPLGDDDTFTAKASAVLEDVVWQRELDGNQVQMQPFTIPEVDVGWLPG